MCMDDNIIFCACRCSVREPKLSVSDCFKNEMNLPFGEKVYSQALRCSISRSSLIHFACIVVAPLDCGENSWGGATPIQGKRIKCDLLYIFTFHQVVIFLWLVLCRWALADNDLHLEWERCEGTLFGNTGKAWVLAFRAKKWLRLRNNK